MNNMMHKRPRPATLAVCAIALFAATGVAAKNWSAWGAPASIETIPGSSTHINTAAVDGCPNVSPDGLSLFFTSNRSGGLGGVDIWTATRSSTAEGFGTPVNLGAPVNSAANEFCPTMTHGKRLFFSSGRSEPNGDLYVSRIGPNGWSVPSNLGPNINSSSLEESASVYEDDNGSEILVYSSRREGRGRIYYSVDYGPAVLAPGGVNSVSNVDQRPSVSHNGREIFWDSTRFGTLGGPDIWTATRSSTSDPWGSAVHLGSLSSPGFDARPFISQDGSTLYFASIRAGGEGSIDTYVTTRDKITGQ